jgi:CHAT domain-containing protein
VPIHAAGVYEGTDQECCSDYVVSSYTPTLAALHRAQQSVRAFKPEDVELLAIAAEQSQHPNMPRLRCVTHEAQGIIHLATKAGGAASADMGMLTKAGVLAKLESAKLIHLACHGIQHRSEPHKSHFCLTTGDLSVSELMKMDLKNAFFAFLSACETAKGDSKHADEVVHLAATMLFASFKSVVATMW